LEDNLLRLSKQNPNLVRAQTIAHSAGGRKVWLIEVGAGSQEDRGARPAMLVVAGIEGNDLAGTSITVSWVERLVEQYDTDCEITELLDNTTIYLVPRVNPDAAQNFFVTPKFETRLSSKPVDSDHDGLIDEDGPGDLNADGLITSMRVEDKKGEYILDPVDDRLLLKAEHLKGEVGAWRYLSEGLDNDQDEKWNEDGPGGVNFNRNFPYDYKFFAADAGIHQISEAETRALAEFVVAHPNIGIVVTYGAADNLLETPKGAPSAGRRKPMTAVDEEDVGYYKVMGEKYREALGLDKELEGASQPGTFSDWMYFHRGRLSLAAQPWSPATAVELCKAEKETSADESAPSSGLSRKGRLTVLTEDSKDRPHGRREEQQQEKEDIEDEAEAKGNDDDEKSERDTDKRNKNEREQLAWFDEHAPEAFVAWQPIEHPDFPGQRVEVGGYAPFALTNPPADMLEEIAAKHADFLTTAAQKLPRVGIRKIETRHLGQEVYEIKIQVENTGFLPTVLAHGRTTRELHPTRVVLEADDECFLSGKSMTTLPPIQGSGGMAEIRYIMHVAGREKIEFKVVSMLAGQVEGVIELKQNQ
jgi:hypothetical protein